MLEEAVTAAAARDRWLTPGVRDIGLASLLADLGHEVPTALLPGFLTSTLGAPAAALGLIEGVADGLAGGARLAGGALADDPERRRATTTSRTSSTPTARTTVALASSPNGSTASRTTTSSPARRASTLRGCATTRWRTPITSHRPRSSRRRSSRT